MTLLTDFGTADGYVAELKGVLLGEAPGATLVDAGHDVAPQDVDGARLALARYWLRYPAGTVHVVVVDPGVGTERAALAVESEGRRLVGPDNGVLTPALLRAGARAVRLAVPARSSATFHGRDVFAPAAARLAAGAPLDALGTPVDAPFLRRTPEARRLVDGGIEGQVITVDRFGNAITNLVASGATAAPGGLVQLGDPAWRTVPIRRVYADVAPGEPVALAGSNGLLEIAVRDGSAAAGLGLARGAKVVLYRPG